MPPSSHSTRPHPLDSLWNHSYSIWPITLSLLKPNQTARESLRTPLLWCWLNQSPFGWSKCVCIFWVPPALWWSHSSLSPSSVCAYSSTSRFRRDSRQDKAWGTACQEGLRCISCHLPTGPSFQTENASCQGKCNLQEHLLGIQSPSDSIQAPLLEPPIRDLVFSPQGISHFQTECQWSLHACGHMCLCQVSDWNQPLRQLLEPV